MPEPESVPAPVTGVPAGLPVKEPELAIAAAEAGETPRTRRARGGLGLLAWFWCGARATR
jgi:hypothetical protein